METPSMSHASVSDYQNVYEPAEDSFLLIDALEQDLPVLRYLQPSVCWEVGSGSGIVLTALAKSLGNCSIYMASDISMSACQLTKRTSFHNDVSVEVVNADLFNSFQNRNLVDVLIFNPPYVVTPSEEISGQGSFGVVAQSWAGGRKGREVMDRLFPSIPEVLSAKGVFYLLIIADNSPEEVISIMHSYGFHSCKIMERKIRGEHLIVFRFMKNPVCAEDE